MSHSYWYYNSSVNNLDYWGLDYPPLSAFHSYGVGRVIQKILPAAVKLGTSRGFESQSLKFLMRLSVSASDLLMPALVTFFIIFQKLKYQYTYPTWLYSKFKEFQQKI